MAKYIESEKALEECDWYANEFCECEYAIMPLKGALENLPAADVREVVLCRECQNSYEWANVYGDNYRYCGYLRGRWNHDNDRMVDDDDFCKWGRKKEADDGT